ncbi:hypothetical protein GW17_00060462 [Ensete ventricosum]|nr:hypothetical protein GW17_00060462 [Ensete ventricosum]
MLLFPVSPVASSPAPIITAVVLVNHSRCPLLQPPLLPVASHPFIFSVCCLSTVAHAILHLLPVASTAASFAFSPAPIITVAALVGYSRCPPIQPLLLPTASHPLSSTHVACQPQLVALFLPYRCCHPISLCSPRKSPPPLLLPYLPLLPSSSSITALAVVPPFLFSIHC